MPTAGTCGLCSAVGSILRPWRRHPVVDLCVGDALTMPAVVDKGALILQSLGMAVILAPLLAPVFLWAYRRRVIRYMKLQQAQPVEDEPAAPVWEALLPLRTARPSH